VRENSVGAVHEVDSGGKGEATEGCCGGWGSPPDREATPQWWAARPDRHPHNMSSPAPGRAHGRPAVARGDWIRDGAGLFPSGFPSPPPSLAFLVNLLDLLYLGEFEAATLAVTGWVLERVYSAGRRPFSSPCDRINFSSARDSPMGFAVFLSPGGKGWAVDCAPAQILPRSAHRKDHRRAIRRTNGAESKTTTGVKRTARAVGCESVLVDPSIKADGV